MKSFPHASVILLAILLVAMLVTWVMPAVTFDTVFDEALGYDVIDQNSVERSGSNKVYPWQLPGILIRGVESVLSTLVLIGVFYGTFAILNSTGMFSIIICRLCERFKNREKRLLLLVFTGFSVLGLVVVPHCFISFAPLIIALAMQMGYDPLVGLAMVLFGATTSSMTGPINAVTAMCQESVGLPIYSGVGVRFVLFAVFHAINAVYLLRYAEKVRKNPEKSLLAEYAYRPPESTACLDLGKAQKLTGKHVIALAAFVGMFVLIILGSTIWGFSTNDISGVFLAYAILVGPVLGYSLSETIKQFGNGVKNSTSTLIVISFAGAVTLVLKQGGIFTTLLYYTSSLFTLLPAFLVPTGFLFLVSLLNCILPSGPAKGVMIMPLLGPAAQLSGMTMQTSVLTYTLGDSFSNYLLPYDATTASFLETARIPFRIWVKFVFKLFLIWNLVGIASLTVLYYVGYGPF